MLVDKNAVLETDDSKFNVIVNGVTVRFCVPKYIAESYIRSLTLEDQARVKLIPVTSDGKQILFG